jgi:uncharacterized cupredoxin-like copper-binding protein
MRVRRILAALAVVSTAAALLAACGSSKSSSGSTGTTSSNGGVTVSTGSGTTVNVVVSDTKGLQGPMTMTVTPASVSAGDVTFAVKNTGTIEHEVIVLKTDTAYNQLPVTDAGDPPVSVSSGANKVDEGTSVGETGDENLKPGESRSFTVKNMTAGKYVLVCNIAQHYGLGMRAAFTVT